MKHSLEWYQERFGEMKIDFQTRRNRADNELLVFWLGKPFRITYIGVNRYGVAINGECGLMVYADWLKGDRFERMYEVISWMAFPGNICPPQIRCSDDSAWEDVPQLIL